jgi:C4-dicarboxylate transporter, DctQ subunit
VRSFERLTGRLEEGLIAAILAAMTLLTFLQVVLRYGFNSGFTWALETTTYLFGWLVLMGISYGVRVNAHIGVDVLVKQLGPAGARAAALLAGALSVLYAAIMLVGSWNYVAIMHTLSVEADDIPIQRWVLLSALPIGFTLLLLRLVQATVRAALSARPKHLLADEARAALERMAHGHSAEESVRP